MFKQIGLATLAALLFAQCGGSNSDALQQELAALKQRVQNDSLMLLDFETQFSSIDSAISQVMRFTDDAYSMDKRDLKSQIQQIDRILTEKNAEIEKLQKDISRANGSAKAVATLKKSLEDKQRLMEQQAQEVEALKMRISELQGENERLVNETAMLQQGIQQKDEIINAVSNQVAEEQRKLEQVRQEAARAEQTAKAAQQQTLSEYYMIADQLIESARLVSKPKAKEDLASKAYQYLCKAHKANSYQALQRMDALKADKELGKFLKTAQCN